MFDDEDFSSMTSGLGDLDGDGDVDFVEYMNEEDDYQRIMGSNDDDSPVFSDDEDEDDDWKSLYMDTAVGYGLDPEDFLTKEELLEALTEARDNTDDNAAYLSNGFYSDSTDYDYEDEEDDELDGTDGNTIPFADFDISKLTLTIGAHTSLDYDGKPIDQVFGNREDKKSKTQANNPQHISIERKYYDRDDRKYRIGDAIYDNFKEIRDNYEKEECEEFSSLITKIYSVNKALGISIWVWALENFNGALVNRGVDKWDSQAWSLTDCIFSDLATIDSESDNEEENTYIFRYVSQHPEIEEIIYHTSYVEENLFSITKYIPYCVDNNLRENFLHVYNGIMTNRFRNEEKMSKYSIIEDLLSFCSIEGVKEADPWFYAFFEKEIKALSKPLKEAYLLKKLNKEEYAKRVFLKPEKENLELDDEFFGKSDTSGEISAKEYKKLKNENKSLKSKVTQLENTITDLRYSIQRLEKDLAAKRNIKVKEWDGKYYRYCKVALDESPNGLWYRTDDITIKKDNYVYVPFGYKDEERMAKVVLVEEFRSDDLPFPLERTKFICYKCDA